MRVWPQGSSEGQFPAHLQRNLHVPKSPAQDELASSLNHPLLPTQRCCVPLSSSRKQSVVKEDSMQSVVFVPGSHPIVTPPPPCQESRAFDGAINLGQGEVWCNLPQPL